MSYKWLVLPGIYLTYHLLSDDYSIDWMGVTIVVVGALVIFCLSVAERTRMQKKTKGSPNA